MKPEYLFDLELPTSWPWDTYTDPMHPEHGPLPNLSAHIFCNEIFFVALWDTGKDLLVYLEMLKEEETLPEAPLLPIDECYHCRGWIAQTYRWVRRGNTFVTGRRKIVIPTYRGGGDKQWTMDIYRKVMLESVVEASESRPYFMS